MPSKPVETALRDMLHHIELTANFAAGFDRAPFKRDLKTVYAVTRCLEIISEASRRLPDEVAVCRMKLKPGTRRSVGSKWLARETSIATTTKTLRLSWCGKRSNGRCRLCEL
jgi:Protein of unknown function DUF86